MEKKKEVEPELLATVAKVTKSEKAKLVLYEKYKTNLNTLIDSGILNGNKDECVCPICLRGHKSTTEKDSLSIEHVPPDALGGKPIILTCQSCNNDAGRTIDNSFIDQVRMLDKKSFLPNSKAPIDLYYGDKKVNAELNISEANEITVEVPKKHNSENAKKDFEDKAKVGIDSEFSFKGKKPVSKSYIKSGMLKTAYCIFFQKTGHAYIYDDCFDIVRKQIQHPEKDYIPDKFFFNFPDNIINEGVYFIKERGMESVLVVYEVKQNNYKLNLGILMPLGKNTYTKIVKNLTAKFKKEKKFNVLLQPITNDLLTDMKKVEEYGDWIDDIKL